MKEKKFNTAEYRNSLQESFSGADGWDSMDGDEDIYPSMNFGGEDPAMNANGPAHIAAPELNFTITNANALLSETARLFGAGAFLSAANFGSDPNITITPDFGIPYAQVLRDTSTSPFTIGMVRMQSTGATGAQQVLQNLLVVSANIYGSAKTDPINMVTSISEFQFNNTISRSAKAFDITSDVHFSFTVLALTTLTCTVYVKNKVNIARALDGRATIGQYIAPNTGIKPVMVSSKGGLKQIGK